MNAADWKDLTARLAAHHDWPGLWKLAKELPVLPAAIAITAIAEGWQPDGQRDRELLTLLGDGDSATLNPARRALDDLQEISGLHALADKPQPQWRPADLATAVNAAPDVRRHPAAWPFHDLLLRCLEHHFGADVQLGPGTARTGPDEINIAQDTE